jgi:hypothetical protein
MRILSIIFLALAFCTFAKAQACNHASDIERWEQIKITYPGKITSFDGKTVNLVMEDGKEVRATSIEIDASTKLPPNFKDEWKQGLWVVLFCGTHPKHIYQIFQYKPK